MQLGVQQTLVELRESRYSPVYSHEGERTHAWVTTIDLPFTTIDWINTVTPFSILFSAKEAWTQHTPVELMQFLYEFMV